MMNLLIVLFLTIFTATELASITDDRAVHNHFYFNGVTRGSNIPWNLENLICPKPSPVQVVRSGKRGPEGRRGPPGPPGRGVDDKVFNSLTDNIEEMKSELQGMEARMDNINPGSTLVGHNSEGDYFVDGCETAGCYRRDIVYEKNMTEIRTLISNSRFCRQFMRYQCHGSILYANQNQGSDRRAWWVSGSGIRINRWAGARANYTCPCNDQGNCVAGSSCNCDRNDAVWRSDEGYVTDKDLLPVTQLRFGDIGDEGTEMGFHMLGKLECYA